MITYDRVDLDLSVANPAGNPLLVSVRGVVVAAVSVLAIPAGAIGLVNIRFGISNPSLPIGALGMEFTADPCESLDDGVYIDNPALSGILTLYIGRVGAPTVSVGAK